MAHHLLFIKLYQNTPPLIYLDVVCVCFHGSLEEMSHGSRELMALKAQSIHCMALCRNAQNIFHRFVEIWERDAGDYVTNTFILQMVKTDTREVRGLSPHQKRQRQISFFEPHVNLIQMCQKSAEWVTNLKFHKQFIGDLPLKHTQYSF